MTYNILLSYAKGAYNPSVPLEKNPSAEFSAAINARILYSVLLKFGNVDYIDSSEWESVKHKHYNLVVAINHNFDNIATNLSYDKLIYYAVNQHPASRNKIIEAFAEKHKKFTKLRRLLKLTTLNRYFNSEWEKEYAPIINSINKADNILCLGNDIVKNSYINNGYPKDKIISINYELMKGKAKQKEYFSPVPKILYVGTELCLRKGFDILYELVNKLYDNGYEFELTIIGKPRFAYYFELYKKLKQKLKNKLKYHKLVLKEEYQNIIKQHDFYIFPTIEEGQAGTVLDAMHKGLIPIITQESGIDFSPLGFLEPKLDSKHNADILKKLFELQVKEKFQLSASTVEYYNQHHVGFEQRLHEIFHQILNQERG